MILACPLCAAEFSAPDTAFDAGPRKVRCSRCRHVWEASKTHHSPPAEAHSAQDALPPDDGGNPWGEPSAAPEGHPADGGLTDGDEPPAPPPAPSSPAPETPPEAEAPPLPPGLKGRLLGSYRKGLQVLCPLRKALWQRVQESPVGCFGLWQRPNLMGAIGGVLLVLLGTALLYAKREGIMAFWPAAEGFYAVFGYTSTITVDGLLLRNVRSEQRYENGTVQLVVEGDIINDAGMPRVLPDIQVAVLGLDGKPIQSWRIPAPVARLDAMAATPFRSSVPVPQAMVVEVKIEFAKKHDGEE